MSRQLVAILLLFLAAGCADSGRLTDPTALYGREVAAAIEPPRPLDRRAAEVSDPSPVFGQAIGGLVTGVAAANETQRTRIGSVIAPELDPARVSEDIVADHLVRSFGAVIGTRNVRAESIGYTDPLQRAPEIARLARLQGIGGVVVDVHTTEMAAVSTGVGLGLRPEASTLRYAANLAVVDAETGRLLASGSCLRANEDRQYSFPEMQAGGQPLMDQAFQTLAQQCAAQLISRLLL